MKKIRIIVDDNSAVAELSVSKTSEAIWDALPIENTVNTWGEEIYFEIPVKSDLDENAKEVVEKGDLGYWPTGRAFCIFFGLTPASEGDEIRPASAVNIVGKVSGDTEMFKSVQDGTNIKLEKIK
ncbi:MAG: cyclophilin-like fold protein [Candidatus Scalinduaceae bacterium]